MKKQMHIAAQYLAAAGISFLDKKEDDSHTNLGFNTETGCLETHFLSENKDQLLLSYKDFSLLWKSNTDSTSFKLDGMSHKEIMKWLNEISHTFLNKTYTYKLHYDLPYGIDNSFMFKLNNPSKLKDLMHLRMLTQLSLEKIIENHHLNSDIRVWPHHFDTGIYAQIPDSNISVGLGLAIPDSVCDEHYLYASGYNASGQLLDVSNFGKLNNGYWSTQGFNGGVFPASTIVRHEAINFFTETIHHYKNLK